MRPRACAALLVAAACGGEADPCDDVDGTCVAVRITAEAETAEQVYLDLLWGDRHAAVTVLAPGATTRLPARTALAFPEVAAPVRLDVVAGIAAGGDVIATGHGSTTLVPGEHLALDVALAPRAACDVGTAYCGGEEVAGAADVVYACTATIPAARGRCPGACVVHPTLGETCAGVGGTCVAGGFYCGGDKLDGDPATLYECGAGGNGINPRVCPDGCVVAPAGSDDYCR